MGCCPYGCFDNIEGWCGWLSIRLCIQEEMLGSTLIKLRQREGKDVWVLVSKIDLDKEDIGKLDFRGELETKGRAIYVGGIEEWNGITMWVVVTKT